MGESGEVEDFDNGLLGMAKGETRELTISFPADYYNPNVAGQTAVYEVTLLQFTRTPELTDEWVAANTDVKTVDEYRESVRKQLEDNADLLASYDLYAGGLDRSSGRFRSEGISERTRSRVIPWHTRN